MNAPDPKANTTTEAYLAYKAGYLEESELKPVLYEPYLHFDAWLAYWAGLTVTYPVKNVGKNLFDKNHANIIKGYFNDAGAIVLGVSGRNRIIWLPCKENTTYTVKGQPGQGINQRTIATSEERPQAGITVGVLVSGANDDKTFTTPKGASFILIRFQSPIDTDIGTLMQGILDTLQIEEGSTASDYESYTGEPEMLCDEEALVAYLSGVTDTYPEDIKDPYDVRIVGYLKHLVAKRWPEPDYPVNNEEFYLSTMEPTHTSNPTPSADIELETSEGKILDVEAYGDTYQINYAGINLYNPNDSWAHNLTTTPTFDDATQTTTVSQSTSTSSGTRYARVIIPVTPGGTYTLSATNITRTEGITYEEYVAVREYINDAITQVKHSIYPTSLSDTFTVADDCTALYLYIYVGNTAVEGATISVRELQVNEGAAIAYEPYTGGIPSPSPDYPQNVECVAGVQTMSTAWKNLFNKNNPYQFVGYFDNNADDPVLRASGGNRNRVIYVPCKPNTAYSISLTSRTGVNSPQVGTIDSFPVDGLPVISLGSFASDELKLENKTTPASAKFIVVRFQTSSASALIGDVLPGIIDGLQIEEGETATEYKAFQGQKYIFTLDGNLFNNRDFNDIPNGYDASGKITLGSGNANDLFWIPCKPNTAYSFKFPVSDANPPLDYKKVFTTEAEPAVGVTILNSSANIAKDTETYENFVTDSNAHYLCVRVRGNNLFDAGNGYEMSLASLKIVEGETLAPVEPIELNKLGTYQDYIYKNGDDWYLHKETTSHVLQNLVSGDNPTVRKLDRPDGSTYFQCRVNGDSTINGDWHSSPDNAAIKSAKSTHFVVGNAWGETTVHFWLDATNLLMFTPGSIDNTQTTTQFIEWVNTNKPEFYHVLATPTETKITNSLLVSQLEALLDADTYDEKTLIMVTANDPNLPALLKVEAYSY